MPVFEEFNHVDRLIEALERRAGLAVRKTIGDIHKAVDVSMEEEKHGATYRVGGTAKQPILYVASAPGEAPAVDTGKLMGNVEHKMIEPTTGEVAVAAEYAVVLETGGPNVAARPFLGPAVEKALPDLLKALKQVFDL